ncbi:hypothetical protein ACFQ3Z_35855 [Streptomyces nogalater]
MVLLYSLAAALFLFSAFPDSMTEGRALGFGIGGAAGFAAFFLLASFTWLSKTRRLDEVSAQLRKATRENTALRRQLSQRRPRRTPRGPSCSAPGTSCRCGATGATASG